VEYADQQKKGEGREGTHHKMLPGDKAHFPPRNPRIRYRRKTKSSNHDAMCYQREALALVNPETLEERSLVLLRVTIFVLLCFHHLVFVVPIIFSVQTFCVLV